MKKFSRGIAIKQEMKGFPKGFAEKASKDVLRLNKKDKAKPSLKLSKKVPRNFSEFQKQFEALKREFPITARPSKESFKGAGERGC